MILLDTNVFVYALGGDHVLRDPARRVLAAARDRAIAAVTIEAVYLELLYVLARRRDRATAAGAVKGFLELLGPPLGTTDADRVRAADLYGAHPGLQSGDALLASVALRDDVEFLLTADRAFRAVPGLAFLDLGSPGLDSSLA